MAYRNNIHESTKERPFYLMYERDMELPQHVSIRPKECKYDLDENYATEMLQRMRYALTHAREQLEKSAEKQSTILGWEAYVVLQHGIDHLTYRSTEINLIIFWTEPCDNLS